MRRQIATLCLAAALAVPSISGAEDEPSPGSPEWTARDALNMVEATGRIQDEYSNAAFARDFWSQTPGSYLTGNVMDQATHPDRPMVTLAQWIPGGTTADPYRTGWSGSRGVAQAIEYKNRWGARSTGHVWRPHLPYVDPLTGQTLSQLPGIVITTGSIQGYEELYWWAAQGLAEAGYVVMTYDVQGQGQSETFGHRPDGSLWCGSDGCPQFPFQQAANFYEGTEDALAWFLSSSNPMLDLVDTSRLGLAGHSLGASAVTEIGNRDPRIDAVVAWDNASIGTTPPRVPTMGLNAEYFFNPQPATSRPNPNARNATFQAFRDKQIPSMQVALRSSTHLEWTYVPYILPASKEGERVAMHYSLAWFDRWLKGSLWDPTTKTATLRSQAWASDATARLTSPVFDDSADNSAIGAGAWDPYTNSNVPHTIGGDRVADHLSFYYLSSYWLDGSTACTDMRAGCQ